MPLGRFVDAVARLKEAGALDDGALTRVANQYLMTRSVRVVRGNLYFAIAGSQNPSFSIEISRDGLVGDVFS